MNVGGGGNSLNVEKKEEGKALDTYPYKDMIKTPGEIGVSDNGNLGALATDVRAITKYVDVLNSGNSDAQFVSPLGNKYFMNTGVTCKDANGAKQERYVFVNNIPNKSIIGSGLVSGILQDIGAMDPSALFKAFSQKEDNCQKITMETRDNENQLAQESRYVNRSDIASYNACWFPDRKNPVDTKKSCREGFTGSQIPKDPIVQLYILGIGCVAGYMAYRFIKK